MKQFFIFLLFISCFRFVLADADHPETANTFLYPWKTGRIMVPYSRTAIAITGPVNFRGTTLSFGGKKVRKKFVGLFFRDWEASHRPVTASVYELERDPGPLVRGNTLCSGRARYVAIWLAGDRDQTSGRGLLNMAVFSSDRVPEDSYDAGLCGTFAYRIEED